MILYPTNALVEDQITRLRKAISKIRHALEDANFFCQIYVHTLGLGFPPIGRRGNNIKRQAKLLQKHTVRVRWNKGNKRH